MSEENIPQEPEHPPKAVNQTSPNKPVITYIMILFIVAFLLMALSFLMHQRSNTEALGELQNSVSAIQEVQATQEENIALQEQLREIQQELDSVTADYESRIQQLMDDAQENRLELNAMTNLYLLQQCYSSEEYESCLKLIQYMEKHQQIEALPTENDGDGTLFPPSCTDPYSRFQELKEAVQQRVSVSSTETD